MPGRPTVCTPELTERIEHALLAGAPITVAVDQGPIAERTYHQWKARGDAALASIDTDGDPNPDDVPETERPYAHFAQTVGRAINTWIVSRISRVAQAGEPRRVSKTVSRQVLLNGEVRTLTTTETWEEYDWRADAWLLERRYPRLFGKATRLEVSGPDGEPIPLTIEALESRALLAVDELEARRQRMGQPDPIALPPASPTGQTGTTDAAGGQA